MDLGGDVDPPASLKDGLRIELRLRPPSADDDATGAVAQHVGERVGDCRHHSFGHLLAGHAKLRMHAGDDDVETVEQVVLLVERPVLVDVDLYAGEDAKGCQPDVEPPHLLELLAQTLRREASGYCESRRVVGEGNIV